MWSYVQTTGWLLCDGRGVAKGYSGYGAGRDNPAMDSVPDVGPIPSGLWTIEGPPEDTETHGPYVLRLVPAPTTETHGRSGFLIHGDSITEPGTASRGCIILPRYAREAIWASGDTTLNVIPSNKESRNGPDQKAVG